MKPMFRESIGFQRNRRVRQYTGKGWLNQGQWAYIEDVPHHPDLVAAQFIDIETDALHGERIMKREDFEPREHVRRKPRAISVLGACGLIIVSCYAAIYAGLRAVDWLLDRLVR